MSVGLGVVLWITWIWWGPQTVAGQTISVPIDLTITFDEYPFPDVSNDAGLVV